MKRKKSARVSTEERDDALRIAEDEAEEREFTVGADQNGAQEKLGEGEGDKAEDDITGTVTCTVEFRQCRC